MFHLALYEPRIAPNTGNVIRLCANNGCQLHLIGELGFELEDKQLRRAGLDYHDLSNVTRHADYSAFVMALSGHRIIACTTRGTLAYDQVRYQAGDVLLFGSETSGLPPFIHASLADDHKIKIPMMASSRSLNLSNAVAIISYEAWRQHEFKGFTTTSGESFS
jgi:tRNA (cytidine/uridine-2'-O-)-methyltransferase